MDAEIKVPLVQDYIQNYILPLKELAITVWWGKNTIFRMNFSHGLLHYFFICQLILPQNTDHYELKID